MASPDWKDKYLAALAQQEKQEKQFQHTAGLLTRAVVRMSLIAEGIDPALDKQLQGMRQVLRDEKVSRGELNLLVDALEGQVKRLDGVRTDSAQTLVAAFEQLLRQLKSLKPPSELQQELKQFQKSLKQRGVHWREQPALVQDYAQLQERALSERKSDAGDVPFWRQWFGRDAGAQAQPAQTDAPVSAAETGARDTRIAPDDVVLDLAESRQPFAADDTRRQEDEPKEGEPEPPFSRLSCAIGDTLDELLRQIEVPPMAVDNYRFVRAQLDKGLNWYELVPTLEQLSIVIVSAFDRHQRDFEQFLLQLNQRLDDAAGFIKETGVQRSEQAVAGRELSASVREQVTAMAQSVAEADELEQLKSSVTARLDQIVSAMDRFQAGEQAREQSLAEQLDALVGRVKTMELQSRDAEQRIEEQRQLALRDVLTQLPNRQGYQQRLEQEYDRWRRYGRPLALVVGDIDHFKRINDGFGHLAGDKVLRIIARALRKRLRKADFIARFGGEEFVILMPETGAAQAEVVINGVREAIATCPFHFREQPVAITMSFGVTEFLNGDLEEAVFARADAALYRAKNEGRNRVVLAAAG